MDIDERPAKAIEAIEKLKVDLENCFTGQDRDIKNRLDRWLKRAKLVISEFTTIEEAEKFKDNHKVLINTFKFGMFDSLNKKRLDFLSQLNILTEELRNCPESILNPAYFDSTKPQIAELKFIHKSILEVSEKLFLTGNFRNAVCDAIKEVNKRIKDHYLKCKDTECDGRDLMNKAFGTANPLILLASQKTESGRNIQDGFRSIYAGAIVALRNPFSHENEEITKEMAIHYLHLASLLMKKLDEASVP